MIVALFWKIKDFKISMKRWSKTISTHFVFSIYL